MINQILKVKDAVAYILSKDPETRDCDKLLYLRYLEEFHRIEFVLKHTSDPYSALKNLLLDPEIPSPESVRRVRQKFQEQGRYLGSSRKRRKKAAREVADWTMGICGA